MRVPKYRKHSCRNLGFVEHQGQRHYFPGKYNSRESLAAYSSFVQQLTEQEEEQEGDPLVVRPGKIVVVGELMAAYLQFARTYYVDEAGLPSLEYEQINYAMKPLAKLYAGLPVRAFGPKRLKRVRRRMVTGAWHTPDPRPWTRKHINQQIGRIRRMFKWGVENELVPSRVLHALQAIQPLKQGRTTARETEDVRPVDPVHVAAVLPYLSPQVAAMVQLQQLTGMRPSNLCGLTLAQIDRSDVVWCYRPVKHKTVRRKQVLAVPIGPRAQVVLEPFLNRPDDAPLFSPREAEAWRNATQRAGRKTPMTPSHAARHEASLERTRKRPPGDKYDSDAYRRAVKYAIKRANKAIVKANEKLPEPERIPVEKLPLIPNWFPYQLRHLAGTEVRKKYKLEGAQVILGHKHANVTEIYAERDWELARKIALETG